MGSMRDLMIERRGRTTKELKDMARLLVRITAEKAHILTIDSPSVLVLGAIRGYSQRVSKHGLGTSRYLQGYLTSQD